MPKSRARSVALEALLARRNVHAGEQTIKAGRVVVDGRVITNPAALVRSWRVAATCESAVTGARGTTGIFVQLGERRRRDCTAPPEPPTTGFVAS